MDVVPGPERGQLAFELAESKEGASTVMCVHWGLFFVAAGGSYATEATHDWAPQGELQAEEGTVHPEYAPLARREANGGRASGFEAEKEEEEEEEEEEWQAASPN
jgi:hypothetical protein